MKCLNCGNEMSKDAKFCAICGTKNSNTPNFCTQCGTRVDEETKFCTNCGAPIEKLVREEEKKKNTTILQIPLDDVLGTAGDIAEKARESSSPKTHSEAMHTAQTARNHTPAQSEMPNAPAASGGTAGAAGATTPAHSEQMRRSAPTVHQQVEEQKNVAQGQTVAETAAQTEMPESAVTEHTAAQPQYNSQSAGAQAQRAASAQTQYEAPEEMTQRAFPERSAQAQPVAQSQPVAQPKAPVSAQTPVSGQVPTAGLASAVSQAPGVQMPVSAQSAAVQAAAAGVTRAAAGTVVSATGAAVGAAVTSVGAQVAGGVASVAGAAVGAAVKGSMSTAKKLAIWAAVVTFLIGAVTACLSFFVDAPEDTVNTLVESVSELDYEKMLSCFDSKTEKMIRASMGIAGDLMGAFTGISLDFEDLMAFAPSMAPYLETPDLGIANAETVLYADCSKAKIMEYCTTANSGGSIPEGYLADNEIVSFLMEYKIKLPGLENLTAKTAIVKITLEDGSVGYLPLINEGWGDWRIPLMDLATILEGVS